MTDAPPWRLNVLRNAIWERAETRLAGLAYAHGFHPASSRVYRRGNLWTVIRRYQTMFIQNFSLGLILYLFFYIGLSFYRESKFFIFANDLC